MFLATDNMDSETKSPKDATASITENVIESINTKTIISCITTGLLFTVLRIKCFLMHYISVQFTLSYVTLLTFTLQVEHKYK